MHIYYLFCNTIIVVDYTGGIDMGFKIKPDRKETENKTIRFPVPLIDRIEDAIKNTDVTFSGFVIQACNYALENLESEDNGK